MNNSRSRVASRGSGRAFKPPTPDHSRSTKLPSISTSLTSTEESGLSLWSPSRSPGYAVGVCSQQGKRPYQEDQYAIKQFINTTVAQGRNASETHMFGLFDGHAGGRCSAHLSANLHSVLVEEESFVTNLPLALKKSFYTTNEQFLKMAEKNKWHDGSTGNVAVIRDGKLTVANAGDCRALLISNGRPLQMSNDHKPTLPEEQKRIASLGGAVVYCMGVARVNKVLAVSRAFGNRTLRQVIRPDAELMQRELVPGDDFLVMASDGLWDVLRNKDVCDVCYSSYLQRRPQAIAEELVNMALARGSMDNVTCIVVHLADYRPLEGSSNSMEMSFSANSSFSRSGGIATAFGNESVVDTQQLSGDSSDENEDAAPPNAAAQYAANAANSIRLRTAMAPAGNNSHSSSSGNVNNNNNNNNYPPHDISKQRSLGTINPRDLPSLGNESDPFGVKSTRASLVKAASTSSMSSQENAHDVSTSFASPMANSMSSLSPNNPANGFLRPLAAIDAIPPPSSGNFSNNVSLKSSLRNSNGFAHFQLGNNQASDPISNSQAGTPSNKLNQFRSMKSNGAMNASGSNFDAISSMQQQMRAMSRQGSNHIVPRPSTQSMYSSYGGANGYSSNGGEM